MKKIVFRNFYSKGILFLFLSIFLISFVSAQSFDQFVEGANDVIRFLLGDVTGVSGAGAGEVLFVKLLVFIVILSIVNLAVQRVPGFAGRTGVSFIIAVAVSMLSVRYITTASLINFIWLPYGVIGVLLSSLFPFLIGFFFIQGFDSSIIRKVGWTGFFVIFIGLGWMRWSDFAAEVWYKNFALIYVVIALISLLLIWFDRDIHAKFLLAAIEKKGADINALNVATLQTEIRNWRGIISNPASTHAQVDAARRNIRDLENRLKILLR